MMVVIYSVGDDDDDDDDDDYITTVCKWPSNLGSYGMFYLT